MDSHDRGMAEALAAGGAVLEVGGPAGPPATGGTRAAVGRHVGNAGGRARRPKRKRRLPPGAVAPAACPACGHRPGEGPGEVRLLPIELDDDGVVVRHDPGPEHCPRCGRRLVIRLLPITLDEKS